MLLLSHVSKFGQFADISFPTKCSPTSEHGSEQSNRELSDGTLEKIYLVQIII